MPYWRPFLQAWPSRSVIALLALLLSALAAPAQQAGGIAASGSTVHLIRAQVGAKSEVRNGTFVMSEQRSVFYASEDKEVIVYFEWEGDRGTHHCEGSVHGPNGELATMTSFDYVATQPRFAGFWKFPLSPSSPSGGWIFESKVDGQAAGQVTFQVVVAAEPAGTEVVKENPLPTAADLYSRSVAATVEIEKIDSGGHPVGNSSGFFLKDGFVVTTFRSIDGAALLRLRLSNGPELSLASVAAWNLQQDWVILATNAKDHPFLKLAGAKNWNIGDHCYWLDVKSDGSRILSDGQIVGLKSASSRGDRIDFSGTYSFPGTGGALLSENGEVIGILGGALPDSFVNGYGPQIPTVSAEIGVAPGGGIAVAANLLPPLPSSSSTTLQELWGKGLMMPQIVDSKLVLFGMLTQGGKAEGKKSVPGERDLKFQFQHSDSSANALIHFAHIANLKTTAALKLYDFDNRLVAASNPEKISIGPDHPERAWQLPLSNLPAGVYRVDLEIANGVVWRQYFKLID